MSVDIETAKNYLNQVVNAFLWLSENYYEIVEREVWSHWENKRVLKSFKVKVSKSLEERLALLNEEDRDYERSVSFTINGNRELGRYSITISTFHASCEFVDLPAFIFDTDTNEITPIDIDEL